MRKLLFTGASGFLGHNIFPILEKAYDVHTIGLTDDDDIKINLAKEVPPINTHYDVVLHAAGKAHVVPKTEAEKQAFYDVNYQGTINLCKGLEIVGAPKSLIFISTAGVYGVDKGEYITEDTQTLGESPYAKSKIMAENYLLDWCSRNNVILTILRPALLIGKDAPGNFGAMIDGIKKGVYMNIAGGKARKSILMVQDIGNIVLLCANKGGIYNVCDSTHPSYEELSCVIAKQLGKRKPLSIPYWIAWCIAKLGDVIGEKAPFNSYRLEKMTTPCTFSNEKAIRELGWRPISVLDDLKLY